ncbi:MAG: acyl-CoA dehydrogenase, partial [Actinomycetia bacterium]|nr:acyl-CoA dehydrogenase [Actinomycetes bacterium]
MTPDPALDVEAWVEANWDREANVGDWWRRLADEKLTHPMLPEPWGRGWSRAKTVELVTAMTDRSALGPPGGLGMMLAAP